MENNEIVGTLYAQGGSWDLLELYPRPIGFERGVRRVLKDTTLEFLVLIDNDPRYILVAGGFVIIPSIEPDEEVKSLEVPLTKTLLDNLILVSN